VFSTAADNQPSVEINVLQGERSMAKDNKQLGRFVLGDIAPAQRGTPQIEVTFDIDASGILSVSAKDKNTGKEQKIKIEASSGLSQEEIERMRREAEINADADKKAKELIDKVNQADSLIFQTEKTIRENGDKLSEGNKSAINGALATLKVAHASQDADGIDKGMKDLNDALMAASSEFNAAGGQGEPSAQTADANSSTQDAEYEEVK
jgi:molecular chaperone DnaK